MDGFRGLLGGLAGVVGAILASLCCLLPLTVVLLGVGSGAFMATTMAYRAVSEGAAGVDMGRNIFQSEAPIAMIQAVGAVVHQLMKPEQAYDLYQTLRRDQQRGRRVAV